MSERTPFPNRPMQRQTLSDQLAESIAQMILSGSLTPGDTLPSEPDLARQYGVSRAVVRDATHLLAARGLVEVRHGKGVFVTPSQREAFGDALRLTLQRAGATAWDLEEFEQMLFPAVVKHVIAHATDREISQIREASDAYIARLTRQADEHEEFAERDLERPFAHILHAIYAATHNEVMRQIGEQLLALRRPRDWLGINQATSLEMDRIFLEQLLDILETRNQADAEDRVARLMELPQKAILAMKATPIGEIPRIDIIDRQDPSSLDPPNC